MKLSMTRGKDAPRRVKAFWAEVDRAPPDPECDDCQPDETCRRCRDSYAQQLLAAERVA